MKKLLLVAMIGVFAGGCTMAIGEPSYDFVDFGINQDTDDIVVAEDKSAVAWVYQEDAGDNVRNTIFMADKNGDNKIMLIEIVNKPEQDLRIMRFNPETKSFIYAIEYQNDKFGPETQREVFFKFFDEENAKFIGKDFIEFFDTDRGVMGVQVGKAIAYYQFSMNNLYAIDSVVNYNQNQEKEPSLFTDALVNSEKTKIVYVHSYEPETQGYNENKVLISDLEGGNRRELVASANPIELIRFEGNQVVVKIGDEEQSFTIE